MAIRLILVMLVTALAACASPVEDPPTPDQAIAPTADLGVADLARPAPDRGPDASPLDALVAAPDAALPDAMSVEPDLAAPDLAIPDAAPPDAGPMVDLYPTPGWRFPLRETCAGRYGAPAATGMLDAPELVEISGLVASPSRDGLLWGHVDSGGEASLYAISTEAEVLGRVQLGVEAEDWEDLAAASCPDREVPCLWVADTGDNRRGRPLVTIYATPEPAVPAGRAQRVWRFPAGYPDGPVDVEAMVVAPDGSTFWLFEKAEAEQVRVFAPTEPLVEGRVSRLAVVATFAAPGIPIANGRLITAADLHPEGERLAIRVYTGSYEYRLPAPLGLASLGELEPTDIALGPLSEPQGEAIAYDNAGTGVWTISESPEGEPQPLNFYPCRD